MVDWAAVDTDRAGELGPRFQGASRARRVAFTALLAVAIMVSTLNVPVYSVLSRFIIDDLGISRSQFGWLITFVNASAAVSSPISGRLTDRIGGRRAVLAIFALSFLAALAIASAPTFPLMVVASVAAGVANAAGNPGTNKLIVTRTTPQHRGLVVGVKQSGVQLGVLAGGLALPTLAVAFGWRVAVLAVAVVPLAGAVWAWMLLDSDLPGSSDRASSGVFHHTPGTWWIAGYAFVMGMGTAAVVAFVPLFAQEAVGTSATVAGLVASALGLSGVIARVAWSVISQGRDHLGGPMATLAALAVAATAAIWASAYLGVWSLWIGVMLAGASASAWIAVANLAVVSAASGRHTGRASGAVVGAFLAGLTVSPVAFGYSVDATGGYDVGWLAVAAAFGAGIVAAVSWRWWERRTSAVRC